MTGPLAGFRIVDLSAVISGPMATQMLADQGAEVIKIEPVGLGDISRWLGPARGGISAMFATVNRNKQSVALNLKNPKAKALLLRLIATADVFVENFRPGAVRRMGLDAGTLRALNPGLIHVSMSGFGETGPYAGRRVYDPVIQAISGFTAAQADATGTPEIIRTIVCDKVAALTAAQAITAALVHKARTGEGQALTLNMLDAAIAFLWPDAFWNHTFLGAGQPPSAPELASFYQVMPTQDGAITIIALSDDEFADMARALGRVEWTTDARFRTLGDRLANAAALRALVRETVATVPTMELSARLAAEDVPHAPVLAREDVLRDAQVVHNAIIAETVHPSAGPMRLPRGAARFHTTSEAPPQPAPLLGEHTAAVLSGLGLTAEEIVALKAEGAAG